MTKVELSYEGFLMNVNPEYHESVRQIHRLLTAGGCSTRMELAKNGYVVSYTDRRNRVLMNFVFRKGGLMARVYGDNAGLYTDYLETLPAVMQRLIEKAPVCRRLADITKCNPRCRMGYVFTLNGALYQKCQYGCFFFPVNDASIPYISDIMQRELAARHN